MQFIYKITNLINNKIYIGKTTNVNNRWSQHKSCIGNPKYDTPLYRAMLKYGIENFIIEIVDKTTSDLIDDLEIKWIAESNSIKVGYNVSNGGTGGDMSKNKSKLEKLNKNKLHSDVMKKLRSNPDINKKYIDGMKKSHQTIEFRQKMQNSMKISHSRPDVKKNLSKSIKKTKWLGYVNVIDVYGNIKKYDSAHKAAESLNTNPHSIITHCKNATSPKRGICKNYKFYFEKS